ncbi:hypothetical protein RUND412_010901 [Rhizina undulata]
MVPEMPNELVLHVFSFLNWKERIDCSLVSKQFNHLVNEPSYWRGQLEQIFRVPKKELCQPEEFKEHFKLLVTSRLYTWGDATGNRLGFSELVGENEVQHGVRGVSLPTEVRSMRGHTVVDLKMGGSATYVLNSAGQVYCSGMDSSEHLMNNFAEPLNMPPVCQISASLKNMLALTDDGKVYFFHGLGYHILPIEFSKITTIKHDPKKRDLIKRRGAVKKIVSGMRHNSAFIEGYGIVVWNQDDEMMLLTMHPKVTTVEEILIPGTAGSDDPNSELLTKDGERFRIGAIKDYALLHRHMVFITEDGKVYACRIPKSEEEIVAPVRLYAFEAPESESPVVYISGNYERFAVHNPDGLVFMGVESMLAEALIDNDPKREGIQPLVIPELQNLGVVQMAAGDNHWLARTKDHRVFSLGLEDNQCGCLGLGGEKQSVRRGVERRASERWGQNTYNLTDKPLQVFFGVQPFTPNTRTRSGYLDIDGDNYKAFTVAAGGCHSGALVFVMEPKKDKGKGKAREDMEDIEIEDMAGGLWDSSKQINTMMDYGHTCGIVAMESSANSMHRGLSRDSISNGMRSTFGLDGSDESAEEPQNQCYNSVFPNKTSTGNSGGDGEKVGEDEYNLGAKNIKPPNERGHRGGIVGMESAAKGMRGGLSDQSIASGGRSAFNFNPNATSFTMGTIDESCDITSRLALPHKCGAKKKKAEGKNSGN